MTKLENCQKCGKDSLDVWMANQCLHMICNKCLAQEFSIDDCNHCNAATQKFWCPGRKYGCKFQKSICETKQHVKTCGFVPVSCPNECDQAPSKKSLADHVSFECRLRITECQFCGQGCYALKLTAHLAVCEEALVSCNYCHEDNIRRGFLPVHARDCSKTPKPCPMKKHGCIFEAVEAEINEHLNFRNHVSCFDDMHERIQELELMNTMERSNQRVQGTTLETNQPAMIGGVSLFDKKLIWVVKLPDAVHPGDLSTIFRHRETSWTFFLEINCAGPVMEELCHGNEELMYSVYMTHLDAGERKKDLNFSIQAETVPAGGRLLGKARHRGLVPSAEKIFMLKFKCALSYGRANVVLVKLTSD
uniref:Putative tumor necrosis factor-mediated signaling pathway n=1 Tax=Ixodes ricinus TaxID=34613 RepID=V5HI04_IXORI